MSSGPLLKSTAEHAASGRDHFRIKSPVIKPGCNLTYGVLAQDLHAISLSFA